jgi:hypothetical protein
MRKSMISQIIFLIEFFFSQKIFYIKKCNKKVKAKIFFLRKLILYIMTNAALKKEENENTSSYFFLFLVKLNEYGYTIWHPYLGMSKA